MSGQAQPLQFVFDRFHEDRFVPNGLAERGPMWQRFLKGEDEYSAAYCRTPLLTMLSAEQVPYTETLLSKFNFTDTSTSHQPLYLLDMLYSFRVWLPLKSGESFPLHPFSQISQEALAAIRSKKLRLVLAHLKRPERNGYEWNLFSRIFSRLKEFDIPPEQVFLIGCDEDWNEHFEKTAAKENGLRKMGGVIYLPYFERGWFQYFQNYLKLNQTYPPTEAKADIERLRPKKFLAFNREPRAHRRILAGWLWQKELLKEGSISFPKPEGDFRLDKFDEYSEGLRQLFSDPELIEFGESAFKSFCAHAPYLVDAPDLSKLHVSHCTKAPFRDSYFSILTERLYRSDNGHCLLTSKAFKAMSNMHPYIMIGPHRSLHFLREAGYKTFDTWIDESYDQEPNSDRRMKQVLAEIEKWARLPREEWSNLYRSMLPVLEHNYNHVFARQKTSLSSYLRPLWLASDN